MREQKEPVWAHDWGRKMYSQVIWDWNGTLLDDLWLTVDVMNEFLSARNMPKLSIGKYREIFDFPVKQYYGRVGFDFRRESYDDVGLQYCRRYEERVAECSLQEGAVAILEYLNARSVKQAVLSSTEQSTLERMVNRFGLARYFRAIIGQGDHHAEGKIGTGERYLACQSANRQEVLLIGDTAYDAAVAKSLGTDCVLVCTGHHPREKLLKADTRVVANLSELMDLFG